MTPEERAEAVLNLIESDFGQSGRDVRFLAIRDEILGAIQEEREACAKVAEPFDVHIAKHIRARSDK